MKKASAYSFSEEFQAKIIAVAVRDPSFLPSYYDVLDPKYMTTQSLKITLRKVIEYYDRYKIAPTQVALSTLIDQYLFEHNLQDDRDLIMSTIDHCFLCDLSDQDMIVDQVVAFGRMRALEEAVRDIIDICDSHDVDRYHEARDVIDKALMVGMNLNRPTFSFSDFLQDPVAHLTEAQKALSAIKTPWAKVNESLRGGLGEGHLGVVMSGSGIGKSAFLVNIAWAAAEVQGVRTYYFPIGDLKEIDIATRYVQRLFGMPDSDIVDPRKKEEVDEKVKQFARKDHPLEIVYFSPATATVQTLRSVITRKMSIDPSKKPGLIIVDYADNLLPTRQRGNGTFLEMGAIYEDLIRLGDDFKCPVWTATQPQRWGLSEEILDVEKVGESWKKVAHADAIITINQSRKEKGRDEARVYMAKVRRGKSKIPFKFKWDLSRMTLKEM